MSATLTTPTSTHAPHRLPRRVRVGQILLTVLLALCALVAISAAFSDDPFPSAAVVLIASFGVLAAAFGLVTVWSVGTSRAARVAVWPCLSSSSCTWQRSARGSPTPPSPSPQRSARCSRIPAGSGERNGAAAGHVDRPVHG